MYLCCQSLSKFHLLMCSEAIIHCSCMFHLSTCIIIYFGLNDMCKEHTVTSDALFPEILHFLASH